MDQPTTQEMVNRAMKRFGGSTKKPAAKKPAAKKPAAKKSTVKKAPVKKATAKPVPTKKIGAKKASTKKPSAAVLQNAEVKKVKAALKTGETAKSHMTSWRIPHDLNGELVKFCKKQSVSPAHASVFEVALRAWLKSEMKRKGDTPGLAPARKRARAKS